MEKQEAKKTLKFTLGAEEFKKDIGWEDLEDSEKAVVAEAILEVVSQKNEE